MTYGPDSVEQYRQEGRVIGKILKGAKPGDLPIERPTRFYAACSRPRILPVPGWALMKWIGFHRPLGAKS